MCRHSFDTFRSCGCQVPHLWRHAVVRRRREYLSAASSLCGDVLISAERPLIVVSTWKTQVSLRKRQRRGICLIFHFATQHTSTHMHLSIFNKNNISLIKASTGSYSAAWKCYTIWQMFVEELCWVSLVTHHRIISELLHSLVHWWPCRGNLCVNVFSVFHFNKVVKSWSIWVPLGVFLYFYTCL